MRMKACTMVAIRLILLCAVFCSIAGSVAVGQEITGTISGSVTDDSGAVVPDATVMLKSGRTGASHSTTTTGAGLFVFNNLPIGEYQLSVQKVGFTDYQLNGIQLHVDDKLNFPIILKVGAVSEKVVVSAEASQLQTESAEISNLVGTKQMLALPLNGRDFNQLVELVPGISPDNGSVGSGTGLFSDTAISVDGNESNSNLFLIDGEYDLDSGGNGNLLVTPSVDAIEEFKILRNNYSAEFGGATGGIVNVITKSGGQTFHGSVFEFFRNDDLDANNFFLNNSGQPKAELRLNNFGFTGGGPIWIPKHYNTERKSDFFFYSFEERRQISGNILQAIVPSQRQRNGLLVPPCGEVTQPGAPCDNTLPVDPNESPILNEPNLPGATPTTPSPLIDPNSVAFMNRMLLPNTASSNGFNFITSAPQGTFDHQNLIRWDHYFGSKTVFTMRYVDIVQTLTNINDQLFGLGDASRTLVKTGTGLARTSSPNSQQRLHRASSTTSNLAIPTTTFATPRRRVLIRAFRAAKVSRTANSFPKPPVRFHHLTPSSSSQTSARALPLSRTRSLSRTAPTTFNTRTISRTHLASTI